MSIKINRMKKTKKIVALMLAGVMLLSVASCRASEELSAEEEPTETTEQKSPVEDEKDSNSQPKPTPDAKDDGENENDDNNDNNEENNVPEEPRWIELVQGSRAQYTIVSDAPIYDKMAQNFAVQMTQATGISFFSKNYEDRKSVSGKKIILGSSPSRLLDDDSVLTYNGTLSMEDGKHIQITGAHEGSVQLAADQFADVVATQKQTEKTSDGTFVKVPAASLFCIRNPESYPYRNATLLGVSLSEYVIVLPAEFTVYDRFVADALIAKIGADTGYRLEYVKDSKMTSAEHRIVVGRTSDPYSEALYENLPTDAYLIRSEGTDLYVAYDNYLVSGETPEVIFELYRAGATTVNEAKTFDFSDYLFDRTEGTDLRLMSSNVTVIADAKNYEIANNINYVDRMEILSQMYLKYLPDFIGLQEMEYGSSVNMFDAIMQRVGHKYSMLTEYDLDTWMFGSPNKEAILYLKDVWQLEASGQGRYNPMHFWYWGVFSRIDDPSVKIIVMNVHYAGYQVTVDGVSNGQLINSICKELAAQYEGVPIFVMGDLNAKYHQSTFLHTVANTTLDSASRLVTDWGDHYTEASLTHSMYKNPIDHILLPTDKAEALSYRFINEALMNISSGHRPIMADIQWRR